MSQKKSGGKYRNVQWKGHRDTLSRGKFALLAILGIGIIALMLGVQFWMGNEDASDSPLEFAGVMTRNSFSLVLSDGSCPDWIEIENVSGLPVNLSGYGLALESDLTRVYTFPAHMLESGDKACVYADNAAEKGIWHAPFRLSAAGENIVLMDPRGRSIARVEVPEMQADHSYVRNSDGNWRIEAPGESVKNDGGVIEDAIVEITEVMTGSVTFGMDENGICHDYVEIHNLTDEAIDLSGWYLSDDEDRLSRWQFPKLVLPAGGYALVHCSGENRQVENHVHASFKLSTKGDRVLLTSPEGVIVSQVEIPALGADQAYSKMNGEWTALEVPTPGGANGYQNSAIEADSVRNAAQSGVYITEMLALSSTGGDWVEIYNGTASAIDISGWGLSNSASRPRKWQFPENTLIQPGQYLGIICDGADGLIKDYLHASFALSGEGGYALVLSDSAGNIQDRLFVPRQYTDISYGRLNGQSGPRYFETPTPGLENTGVHYGGRAIGAVYSVDGGFYNTGDRFTVTLTAQPGQRIYYTLDCTDPDESDNLYTGPITISDTTILRTRVYADDCLPSYMDSRSYLYNVKNGNGTVRVVSMVSDPYNLTSDEAGIMVKGNNNNYWRDWERECHVELFDQQGSTLMTQECAVRQQGQTCRDQPQQSFKFLARSQYGSNRFYGKMFSNREFDSYASFILRPSNDDAYKTRMRDSVLTSLANVTDDLLYQETEVCVAYINGQYWGHYNMRETANVKFICQHEGWVGQEDEIDFVLGNSALQQGSDETFQNLLAWIKKNKTNTDQAYQYISSVIDVKNYIEYMTIEIYVGNTEPSDIKRYRNANDDGLWRWVLFDLDWGYCTDTNSISRWLAPGGMGNGGRTDNTLFIGCMKNPTFRDQFLTYFGQQLATTFSQSSMLQRFEDRYNILKTILPDHHERWGTSENKYNRELKKVISYAKERPGRLLYFLKNDDTLNLSRTEFEKYFGDAMAVMNTSYEKIKG